MTTCAHCGRPWEIGGIIYRQRTVFHLCHHSDPDRPDCYHLVTVYGETIGDRR